jgi:hypothetical protein
MTSFKTLSVGAVAEEVVTTLAAMRPRGDEDADTDLACRVIKMRVGFCSVSVGLRIGCGELQYELLQAIYGTNGACPRWVYGALDRACKRMLLDGLEDGVPVSFLVDFGGCFRLQWHMHQEAARVTFDGLKKWFEETPCSPSALGREGLPARISATRAAMFRVVDFDAKFLSALLPGGLSTTKLLMGLHEVLVRKGVLLQSGLGWLLWEALYQVTQKSVYSLSGFQEEREQGSGEYSLLRMCVPYERMCAVLVEGCKAVQRREDVEWRSMCLGVAAMRMAVDLGAALAYGFNDVHFRFEAMRQSEEEWREAPGSVGLDVFHWVCLDALGSNVVEQRDGVSRGVFVETGAILMERTTDLILAAMSVCANFRGEKARLRSLDVVLGDMQDMHMAVGIIVLEVQRQMREKGLAHDSKVGMQLWKVLELRSGFLLFPRAEYEAAYAAELRRGVRSRAERALRMCERFEQLFNTEGCGAALKHAVLWLRSRRRGFKRVAHQRAAVAEAILTLSRPDRGVHPAVPISIAAAFESAYGAPLRI